MSNLGILLKNNFVMTINGLRGKKKKRSFGKALFLGIFIAVAFVALFSYYAWMTYKNLASLGMDYIQSCLSFVSFICILFSFLRQGISNSNKDSDFLLSLPIKKSTIVLSKTISKYISDFAFYLLFVAPYIVISTLYLNYQPIIYVMTILLCFLLPFFSVGMTFIINFIVSKLFNKTKYAGQLKSLLSLVIFGCIFALYYFGKVNYFTQILSNFVFVRDIKTLAIAIGVAVAVFAIGIALFNFAYGQNTSMYSSHKKTLAFSSPKSPYKLLLKKEFNYYFSTPVYLVNTIIGPIMMIVLTIIILVLNAKTGTGAVMNMELSMFFALLLSVALSATASTSTITAPSISLEKDNLWIIKSSPIKISTVFFSKISLQNFIILPVVIACSVAFGISLRLSFLHTLLIASLPMLITLINSVLGLFFGVCFPVADFDNEAKVVKRSMCVFLTLIISAVLSIMPFIIASLFNGELFKLLIVCLIIDFIILILSLILLFTIGIKKFKKIAN